MDRLLDDAARLGLLPWITDLHSIITKKQRTIGQLDAKGQRYSELLKTLPVAQFTSLELDAPVVSIGRKNDLDESGNRALLAALQGLCPWRKGPFRLFGVDIDCEWVSSMKWDRFSGKIEPLEGRRILDVGSSSGYYMFRMVQARPAMVLGLEPYLTYYFQFRLLQHYLRAPELYGLPAKFEELPALTGYFDTVFSMGVLYHQRSPLESLQALGRVLRPGGELVLETLVLEGDNDFVLSPRERYAKMNNVYFIPTVAVLKVWLKRAGFHGIRCLDVSCTTPAEQRNTLWVNTESLSDFLQPGNPTQTIEGYPAPIRALLVAQKR